MDGQGHVVQRVWMAREGKIKACDSKSLGDNPLVSLPYDTKSSSLEHMVPIPDKDENYEGKDRKDRSDFRKVFENEGKVFLYVPSLTQEKRSKILEDRP